MSEILADAGIAHTVCVATEYGEIVMREQTESTKAMQTAGQPIVNLHCGRMDREQMQKFLHDEGYEIVVEPPTLTPGSLRRICGELWIH